MFPHAPLAHSNDGRKDFQRVADRFRALGFVDHDLSLEGGVGIEEVTLSPSNGVRKISSSFPTTLVLPVGS